MKIMLVNPPWFENGFWGVRAGSRWPHIKNATERDYLPFPFYLAYSTTLLEQAGFTVKMLDAIASELSPETFLQEIAKFAPDILVSEISAPSRENDFHLLKQVPPKTKIVVCGPDFEVTQTTAFLEAYPFLAAALMGEYEQALLALVNIWGGKSAEDSIASIGGLIYRDGNRVFASQAPRILSDITKTPWPHRSTLPMKKYVDAPGGLPLPSVQMWGSRGCPFVCTFCAWPQLMSKPGSYRPRDTEDILNEMEFLVEKMKFRSLYFDDDTFNVGQSRMLEFAEKLIERRKQKRILVPWGMMARADLMTETMLVKLKEAGLFSVKYGVESADQNVLNRANKKMILEKTVQSILCTQELGIKTHLTFTFGLPGETKDTIQKTIDLALSLSPDSLQFSIATPFPGTRLYKELQDKGQITAHKPKDLDGNHTAVIRSEFLDPEDLVKAKDEAYLRWGEHCLFRRTPEKIRFSSWHWRRTKHFFRQHGLRSTFFKVRDYLRFLHHHNQNTQRHRYQTIALSELRLVVVGATLRLFHKGRELTRGVGLQSSFLCLGKRYDTSLCDVRVQRLQPYEFFIEFDFRTQNLPLKQVWCLQITQENQILWKSDWVTRESLPVSQLKFSCMLSDIYKSWATPQETGFFPDIEDWETLPLQKTTRVSLSVSENNSDRNQEKNIPGLELNFGPWPHTFQEQIQNTSRFQYARMIHAVSPKEILIPTGKSQTWNGSIRLLH
jgi:radical SAM superfamily enzyme YgiQ (UPF0313 family)